MNSNQYGQGQYNQQPPPNQNQMQYQQQYAPQQYPYNQQPSQQFQQPPQYQQQYQQQPQNQNQMNPHPPHQNQNQQHPLSQPQPHQNNHNYAMMTRPPFVDPDTQIVYPCNNPEFEGYLTKQSMWIRDWRRRYFILSGSKLFFAKTPYCAPHGMIDLSTATTVKSADLKSRKKNSFEISTHELTYLMYTDTEKEKDDWIGSVGRAIVRASGTFLQKNEAESGNYGDGGEDDVDDVGVFENAANHPYFND